MPMSEQKSHRFRPPLYHRKPADDAAPARAAEGQGDASRDRQGWEAYRKWVTHVSRKPAVPRAPIDNSIYSWKGYQNWADKIRQSWKPEES
jgi:hypothetical protein